MSLPQPAAGRSFERAFLPSFGIATSGAGVERALGLSRKGSSISRGIGDFCTEDCVTSVGRFGAPR